ncbi:MAG: 3'-5' exonuclease [Chitinispirillaceae bacterium]|nr:3'-5' exonuclease [Chitinispirillaceae bacterium]
MNKRRKTLAVPFTRFAAIDFETADYGRDSACAVSVVVAEKGTIVARETTLIKPPRRDFVFSYLHGITWNDVAKKPTFGKLWKGLKPLFRGVDFVAAHNASFDRSVLCACCEMEGLKPPDLPFLCTMKLARRQWGVFPTKLSDVCRHFSIPLKHHDAASDAFACAKIVLEAVETGVPAGAFLKKIAV